MSVQEALAGDVRATQRLHCCQQMSAALARGSCDGGDQSAALLLRAGIAGAIFFKVVSGHEATGHEATPRESVNEPVSFCPFCGAWVGVAAPATPRGPRVTAPLVDEETTQLAAARTRVRADTRGRARVGADTVAM
jgi:hypothetical protein